MSDFYLDRENIFLEELDRINDPREEIKKTLDFIIKVRSSLHPRIEEHIKKALPLCREKEYEEELFSLYTHLAFYYLMNSEYPLGKSYLDRAGDLNWSAFVHSPGHMYYYHAHGVYYYFLGDRDLAADYFQKALELAQALGDGDFTCQMQNNISLNHLDRGEYEIAEKILLQAFSVIKPDANPFPAIKIMENLSGLYRRKGDLDQALNYLDSAYSYAGEKGISYMYASLFVEYGKAYELKGDKEKAEKYLLKAQRNSSKKFYSDKVPLALIGFLFRENRREEAQGFAEKAIEDFRRRSMPGSLDKVYHLMDEYGI